MIIDGKEVERIGEKLRTHGGGGNSVGTRNYGNPEPLNVSHVGKSVTITLINGRTETGKLKSLGQYMLSIEVNGRELIINKASIITVSIQ
jgi:sRNA-binding regulator protein Hfq